MFQINFSSYAFVYNYFIELKHREYNENKKSINFATCSNLLTKLKSEEQFSWLNDADSHCLQQSLRDLEQAYKNFFRRVEQKEKPYGYPKPRNAKKWSSYRTTNNSIRSAIRIKNGMLHIPKVGFVKFRGLQKFNGRILSATIEKTSTGKYFCSLCVEEELEINENSGGIIGIDVGIKEFYTDSNGEKVHNPKPLWKLEDKLIREQRKLSRMQKGSNNYKKQKQRLARVHEQIANQRKDFLYHYFPTLVCANMLLRFYHTQQ